MKERFISLGRQIVEAPRRVVNYLEEENRKSAEAYAYNTRGYLTEPPPEGITQRERSTNDGDYQLTERFAWNQENQIWEVTDRQWSLNKTIPSGESARGIFAGLVVRCRNWQAQELERGLNERQAFFAPPKEGEPTTKSRSWQENRYYGYEYSWNPERNIWDEVGRYEIPTETGGIQH